MFGIQLPANDPEVLADERMRDCRKNKWTGRHVNGKSAEHSHEQMRLGQLRQFSNMASDALNQRDIVGNNHAAAPCCQVLIKSKAVDSDIANRTESFSAFHSPESLR